MRNRGSEGAVVWMGRAEEFAEAPRGDQCIPEGEGTGNEVWE